MKKKEFKTKEEEKSYRQGWSKIANKISLTRLLSAFLLIPIAKVFENLAGLGNVSAVAFSAAVLPTDAIDGFIAKNFNAKSLTGFMLDKFSDKLYFLFALILIAINYQMAFLILAGMELSIFGLSLVKGANGISYEASPVGRSKTVLLGLSILTAFLSMSIPELRTYAEYYNWSIKETLNGINLNGLTNTLFSFTFFMQGLTFIDYLGKENEMKSNKETEKKNPKEVLLEIKNSLIFIKNHHKTISDVDFFAEYQESETDVNKIKELVLKFEEDNMPK